MKRDACGYWKVDPAIPDYQLNNVFYHYLVRVGCNDYKIIDPMAQRIVLVGGVYQLGAIA